MLDETHGDQGMSQDDASTKLTMLAGGHKGFWRGFTQLLLMNLAGSLAQMI